MIERFKILFLSMTIIGLAAVGSAQGYTPDDPCIYVESGPLPDFQCWFSGFLNTPISSYIYLDAPTDGHLVVCNQAGVGTNFGVKWSTPFKTGHEEWERLGHMVWEKVKELASLNAATMQMTSNANYDFSGSVQPRTLTTEMKDDDINDIVFIYTDFDVLGATSVRYEVYDSYDDHNVPPVNSVSGVTPPYSDTAAKAAQATVWPTSGSFGRFEFPAPGATVTLPGSVVETNILVLAIVPVGSNAVLASRPEVTLLSKNIEQANTLKAPASCPSVYQFTIVEEDAGPPGRPYRFPTLTQWGLIVLVLLLLAGGAFALRRHRRLTPA